MSENEKRIHEALARLAQQRANLLDLAEVQTCLRYLLAERRVEVERLGEDRRTAERDRDSWRRRWSEATAEVAAARDAALEEAMEVLSGLGSSVRPEWRQSLGEAVNHVRALRSQPVRAAPCIVCHEVGPHKMSCHPQNRRDAARREAQSIPADKVRKAARQAYAFPNNRDGIDALLESIGVPLDAEADENAVVEVASLDPDVEAEVKRLASEEVVPLGAAPESERCPYCTEGHSRYTLCWRQGR